jgi:hypothetical protein
MIPFSAEGYKILLRRSRNHDQKDLAPAPMANLHGRHPGSSRAVSDLDRNSIRQAPIKLVCVSQVPGKEEQRGSLPVKVSQFRPVRTAAPVLRCSMGFLYKSDSTSGSRSTRSAAISGVKGGVALC